jgi:outer membrane protein assembly factor BamB
MQRLFTKKRLLLPGLALLLLVTLLGGAFLLIPRPTTKWSFHHPGNLFFGVYPPIVSNGLVYAFSDDIYALDAHSGQVRWTDSLNGAMLDAPLLANGLLYVLSDDLQNEQSTLYTLDAASGREQWSHNQQLLSGAPTIANGIVYLHSDDGILYALDALSGHQLWRAQVGADFSFGPPVVANNMVYVTSENQAQTESMVVALDAASGRQEWVSAGMTTSIVQLTAANGLVYFAAEKQVWALDAFSGKTMWSAQLTSPPPFPFFRSLQVVNGIAYIDDGGVSTGDDTWPPGTLYALDARTGQQLWTTSTVTAEPTIADGEMYVYTGYGNLSALDARSGRQRWSHPATPFVDGLSRSEPEPPVVNGMVYMRTTQSNKDTLYALDAASGSEQWSYHLSDELLTPPAVALGIVYASLGTLKAIQPPGAPPGFSW